MLFRAFFEGLQVPLVEHLQFVCPLSLSLPCAAAVLGGLDDRHEKITMLWLPTVTERR